MSAAARARSAVWAGRCSTGALLVLIAISPWRARLDLVPRPEGTVYRDYTDVLLNWSDLPLLALLATWLLSLLLRPRAVRLGPRFIAWPLLVLLAAAWIGIPFAVDPVVAVDTSVRLTLLSLVALYVVNERPSLLLIAGAVAAMITIQAIVGIGEVVAQHSLGLTGLGEHDLSPSLPVSVITGADGTRILRAYGLSDHPNILGGLTATGLLLLAGLIASRRDDGTVLLGIAVALGSALLLVTFSRGAWIALAVGVAVLTALLLLSRQRRQVRRLALTSAAGIIAAAPFVAPYGAAFAVRTDLGGSSSTEARSVNERIALSAATTDIITAHPLIGVGAGGLPEAMRQADPGFAYNAEPASVVLLDVTAETGIAGGTAYLVLLVAPWMMLVRHRARWTPDLVTASAALAAIEVTGFFDYYSWTYAAGRIWAFLVLGIWAAAYTRARAGAADAA